MNANTAKSGAAKKELAKAELEKAIGEIGGMTGAEIKAVTEAAIKASEHLKVVVPEGKATSVHEMMAYTGGQYVTLPPFGEDMPCVVKLKRLSLMALMKQGKIPNTLMSSATNLFNTGKFADEKDEAKDDYLKQTSEMLELFARASMVEPTFEALEEVGVSLTDLQLAAIFAHSQSGVKDLERFPNQ